jgi:hypothetical protein
MMVSVLVDAKDSEALGVGVRKFTGSQSGPQDVESQKARRCLRKRVQAVVLRDL